MMQVWLVTGSSRGLVQTTLQLIPRSLPRCAVRFAAAPCSSSVASFIFARA